MKSWRVPVSSVDDRVEIIKEIALEGVELPALHEFASIALTDYKPDGSWKVPPRNWEAEVEAIHEFIKANIRYTLDPYPVDTYRSIQRTIQLKMGDCDDMAALSASFFLTVGYPVKIKVIRTHGNDSFHHVYILVGLPPENPREWIPIDPSQDYRAGQETPGIVEFKLYDVE